MGGGGGVVQYTEQRQPIWPSPAKFEDKLRGDGNIKLTAAFKNIFVLTSEGVQIITKFKQSRHK